MTAIVGQALLRPCGDSYLCFFLIFYVFLIKMVFPGVISISSFFHSGVLARSKIHGNTCDLLSGS